jgi:beta-glucosidase
LFLEIILIDWPTHMFSSFRFLVFFTALFASIATQTALASSREQIIEKYLRNMTLSEKVGQMALLTLHSVSKGDLPYGLTEPHQLDPERLRSAIVEKGVGAIFNTGIHAMSLKEWREIITTINGETSQTRLKIPILYGIDAVHGMNYAFGATIFPQQMGLAATWDPEMLEKVAAVTAYEARAAFIPWVFTPTMDLGRNPAHSRFYETFGEDTYLTASLGKAMIRGLQSENTADHQRVGATLKHFIGYTQPVSGKDRTPVYIPDIVLQENFIPPFRAGIEAGALAIMLANCELNGVPVHADQRLIVGLLKNELSFPGVVLSDWNSIYALYEQYHVARDKKEAIKLAINAGVDLNMIPFDLDFVTMLKELVENGEVPMSRIDDAVSRILGLKYALGLFSSPSFSTGDYPAFGSDSFSELNLQVARASMTLLKNKANVLPLTRNTKVLVTGFAADSMSALNGGWTYTWLGRDTDFYAKEKNTILEAIINKLGAAQVEYVATDYDSNTNIEKAVAAASRSDVIILCLGELSYAENFGNIDDLSLPKSQVELAQRLADTGKPVILILTEGRPRIISSFAEDMAAIVMAYLPGNEGGNAAADVLFGDAEPGGRLPFTYPRGPNGLGSYDHKSPEGYAFNPQFAFGAGLSFSEIQYTDLTVNKKEFTSAENLAITISVRNKGGRKASEIVQLYVSDLVATIPPPVKRLRAYQKIILDPGEVIKVTFLLPIHDLKFVDNNGRMSLESGEFEIIIGDLRQTIILR